MDRALLADSVVPSLWDERMIARPTERCRQVFHALVGRRTGIVRDVRFVPTIDGDADLHHAAATIANAQPDLATDVVPAGGGSGRTREDALMAALGEGLERYLASSYCRGRAVLRCESELASDTLDPAELAQFSAAQRSQAGFPFRQVTPQTPLRWVTGKRLSDGSSSALPAFAVYLPYHPEPGEPLVAPGISTGLACGPSQETALEGGLCEVIERDALALTWLAGISPRRIDQDWFVDQANGLLPPSDVNAAYDLTSDIGVPVVLVVCRGQGPRGPVISVGSACSPDTRAAVRKAAIEASQDRVYVRHLIEGDPEWRPSPDFANVADFSFHARLYGVRPALADEALSFLDGNPTFSDLHERLEPSATTESPQIIRQLVDSGHDGIWVDLTPPWARSVDLHVVKVVVPTLMPLHGHHMFPYLGHQRLRTRRSALPLGVVNHGQTLWPFPHPFP